MESTISKPSSSANDWVLVQYEKTAQIIKRKILKSVELMWTEPISNEDGFEDALMYDRGKLCSGHILFRTKRYEDAVEKYNCLENILTSYLTPETSNVETMCPKNIFWIIVKYRTKAANGKDEESNLGILYRTKMELKRDYNSNSLTVFIEENNFVYNGLVLRASYDVQDLIYVINNTKIDILKSFKEYIRLEKEKKMKIIKEIILEKEKKECQHEKLKIILKSQNEKIAMLKQHADKLNKLVNNFKSKDKVKENAVKNYWQSILSKLPDYSPEDS